MATFTLLESIKHPDADEAGTDDPIDLTFRVEVTDGDGDTDTADVKVTVLDDEPSITAGAAMTVDEDGLDGGTPSDTSTFAIDLGEDEEGADVSDVSLISTVDG